MALFGKQLYCHSCMSPVRSAKEVCKSCGYDPTKAPSSARYLKPGTVINDRFFAGCVISENSYSVTYMGYDLAENKKKVIKEYCPFSCASRVSNEFEDITLNVSPDKKELYKKGLADFIDQYKKLRDLENSENGLDGIIRITNIVEAKGTAYAVSDYEGGSTLKKALKNSRLNTKEIFARLKPMVNSMITLHKNNIIHGNISPYNIIVDDDFTKATLIGFALNPTDEGNIEFASIPKAGFTPLEQYAAFRGSVGPWTDIYSLCATMYMVVTDIVPPDAPDRTVADMLETFADLNIDISEMKNDAIMQGIEVYERDRFKAVRALYNALYSEDEEVQYTVEEPAPEPVYEPAPEPVPEPAPEPVPEPAPEPVSAPAPEPVTEPVPEPAPEPVPAEEEKPAPAAKGDDDYAQVIIRRKDKNNVEINGQKYSVKLEELDLSAQGISDDDSDSLAMMENLQYLKLDDNKIGSIEFVNKMRELVLFSAKNNYIKDISVLVNLGHIRELYLGGNKELYDISVMEHLRGLRKLDLSGTAVTNIEPLIYLDHLKTLDLRNTAVTQKQIKKLYDEMPTVDIKYDYDKEKHNK